MNGSYECKGKQKPSLKVEKALPLIVTGKENERNEVETTNLRESSDYNPHYRDCEESHDDELTGKLASRH